MDRVRMARGLCKQQLDHRLLLVVLWVKYVHMKNATQVRQLLGELFI